MDRGCPCPVASGRSAAGTGGCAGHWGPAGDGRLALFVAGGVAPGAYPVGAPSRLYWREGTRWIPDAENGAQLAAVGLVNAALWSDLDGDGRAELVLACEWGPLRVFRLTGTVLNEVTKDLGLGDTQGSGVASLLVILMATASWTWWPQTGGSTVRDGLPPLARWCWRMAPSRNPG